MSDSGSGKQFESNIKGVVATLVMGHPVLFVGNPQFPLPEICGREEDDGSGGRVSARGGGHGQLGRVEPQPHVLQRRPEFEELPGTN